MREQQFQQNFLDEVYPQGVLSDVIEEFTPPRSDFFTYPSGYADNAHAARRSHHVESDFFDEIRSRLDAISLYKLDTDFFVALLRFFYDSSVMARISATSVHDSELIAKVRGMIREKVIHDLEGHGVAYDSKKMEGLFGYIVGGCSYLITRWVLTRKEKDIPKVAEECSEYTRKLLSIYLENGK